MDPVLASQQATLEQLKRSNDLMERMIKGGGGGGAPPAAIARAFEGEGNSPSDPKASIHNRLAATRIDAWGGKGLGLARVMRAKANMEKGLTQEQAETKLHLPRGISAAFDTGRVKDAYDAGDYKRAMAGSTVDTGGALAFDEYAVEYIEVLRPRLALLRAGVVDVPMERYSMTIGRQSSDVVGSWFTENQAMVATSVGTDTVQLQLKDWGALVPITNDLLHDAVAADIIIRNSLMAVSQLALDIAMIRGAGTQYTPRGLRYWTASAQVISASAGAGSNTLTTALTDLATSMRLLEQSNVPVIKPAWLMAPRSKYGYIQLRDGTGRAYFADEMKGGTLMGAPFFTTSQIPINLSGGGSGGSAESELYYLETTQWLLGLGLLPSLEVSRDAAYVDSNSTLQSAFSRNETVMRVVLRADFAPMHTQAATVITGLTVQ
jgi:HK97 family phage major capsid protein